MATPKPGEIRCPTCHRSTPPAAFCTQCGSAIPSDARIRPRGMDRDELQERIRARRSGGEPFRRGGAVDDRPGYERYEPDPNDVRARRGSAEDRRRDLFHESAAPTPPPAPPPDLTRDRDDWARPAAAPTPVSAPPGDPYAPPPSDMPIEDEPAEQYDEPVYVDNYDDEAYPEGGYQYDYEDWEDRRERRSGAGALAILGFLALGVLALLGGAVLAGVFSDDPGVGQQESPTPSVAATETAVPTGTPAATGGEGTPAPTGSPGSTNGPIVFPDGFSAQAQPCLPGSAGGSGCGSNGSSNSGAVDIWVGFTDGSANDVIGATLIAPDGTARDGSIDLSRIGCSQSCDGWTYFPFSNLTPGTYEVEITRNGEPAGSTSFEVT